MGGHIIINLILLGVISASNLLMALLVFLHGERKLSSTFFSISAFSSFLWVAIAIVRYITYSNAGHAIEPFILTKLSLVFALSIFFFFLLFSYSFLREKLQMSSWLKWLVITLYATAVILSLGTDFILVSETFIANQIQPAYTWGNIYRLFYAPVLLFFFVLSIGHLYKVKQEIKSQVHQQQLKYILWGSGIAGVFGIAFGLIVATFPQLVDLFWIGRLSNGLLVLFTSFAIFRYHLFNIKVITTELFTFIIWLILLARAFDSTTFQERLINWFLLSFMTLFGTLLIRSVLKEVRTREKLEKTTRQLKHANARLKALDEQKSEMLSLASHQFRSPLTAIKGYASLIQEGSYGKVPEKLKQPIQRIFNASTSLTNVVNDFLNISRIEQGRMQYDFDTVDIAKIVKEVVNEARPTVSEDIDLRFEHKESKRYVTRADRGKIKQVISNLIDNGIKYTEEGHVTARVEKKDNGKTIHIEVEDTGIGIAGAEQMQIFDQFTRAQNASDANVMGTGLGLYIAKKIVEAHAGKIWVESEGKGKGSTFHVELDAVGRGNLANRQGKAVREQNIQGDEATVMDTNKEYELSE